MKTKKSTAGSGFILISALLMLSMGMSTICLLISARHHNSVWRQRVIRNTEARSQHNRLTRISHHLMEKLMRQALPEAADLRRHDHWQTLLDGCMEDMRGRGAIDAQWTALNTDPFEPLRLDIKLSLSIRDKSPGMAHRAILQGVFSSGRFPLGAVPLLVAQGPTPHIPYDALFSQVTLHEHYSPSAQRSSESKPDWFDPLPLLRTPLGLNDLTPDWPVIGRLLELELSGPPPPGVYPVRNQNELKALFVYGNIEHMILSQRENEQKISIRGEGFSTTIHYGIDPPYCSLSQYDLPRDCQFAQNIVVIGNINSLEQCGEYGMAPFCNLYLFVNGAVRITSSLRSVPPLHPGHKKGTIILVAAHALKDSISLPPDIFLDGKKRMELDAQLISEGEIRNNSERLVIHGSISAAEYSGSTPEIFHVEAQRDLPLGPKIRFFSKLFFLGIEELFDDDE